MHNSTAFSIYGYGENAIFFESCSLFNSIVPGGMAYSGDHSIKVVSIDTIFTNFQYIKYTALSLELSQALQVNNWYQLTYYHKIFPHIHLVDFTAGRLIIGTSDSDTIFGSTIDTLSYPINEWSESKIIFQATTSAQYLTMKGMLEQGIHGALVDNFVLVETTDPVGIIENNKTKKLLKIVDVLGKENKSKKGLLFYIYSDGTVEKKLIIE